MQNDLNKEMNIVLYQFVKTIIIILVLSFIVTVIYWLTLPTKLRAERAAFVESHQYKEAHLEAVMQLQQEIARIKAELSKTTDPGVRVALTSQVSALEARLLREVEKSK